MYYIIYPLLWLVSLLPFRVLYFFADIIYVFVFYVFKYRRPVVQKNLIIAFPEKTAEERLSIEKEFYHNMIDAFLESIKFITLSSKAAKKRATADFEIIHQLTDKGLNIFALACHQFNWEYATVLYPLNLKIPFIGVYMPISNKTLDRIFYKFRAKNGTVLVAATEFRHKMNSLLQGQYFLALAADQNPGVPSNAYWLNFFSKPAPFVTGPAKGAVKNGAAVVVVGFKKLKRGHYHFYCKLITENAATFQPEEIAKLYRDEAEKIILADPANYLWSHRRWKYDWKAEYGEVIG